MIVTKICPDCHSRWQEFSTSIDREGLGALTVCCPECHGKRREKLRELEARYPSAESLGLLGQQGDFSPWIVEGMRGKSRRVIRKSEPMAG